MNLFIRTAMAAIVSVASLTAGDLTLTFQSTHKGPMGSGGDGIQTHYYATNFQKTVDQGTRIDTLVDYVKGISYTIHHKEKKVEMISFDDMVAVGEAMNAQMANMPAGMPGMGGDMKGNVKVEKLGPETVAGRACQKYRLTLGQMVQELSLDPTLKAPMNPAAYARFLKLRAVMTPGPMGAGMRKMAEEMSKLQGMALKTHFKGFMGMESTTQATAVDTKAIPANVFALPAGYKTEDLGKKMLKDLQ